MKRLFVLIYLFSTFTTSAQFSQTLKGLDLIKEAKQKDSLLVASPTKLKTYLSSEIYNLYYEREKLGQFKNILEAHKSRMDAVKRPFLGGAYWYVLGKYEERLSPSKALRYYLRAFDYFQQDRDTLGLIFTQFGITEARRTSFGSTTGDTIKTRRGLETAILWAKKIKSPEMEASGWNQLGAHNLNTTKNNAYLLYTSQQAYQAIQKLPEVTPTHVDVFINLAMDYRNTKEMAKSKFFLDNTLFILKNKYPNKWKLALCYQYLGIHESIQKNIDKAESNFLKSLSICDSSMVKEKYLLLQNIALFYKNYKINLEKSIQFSYQSQTLQIQLFKENNSLQLNELSVQYETEKKDLLNKNLQEQNKFVEKRQRYYIYLIIAIACGLLISTYLVIKLRKTNAKLSQANTEIEEFNRTRSYLFGIIAHDLMRPAQAISGVSLLLDEFIQRKDWAQVKEVGIDIVQSANQLQSQSENLIRWALVQKNLKILTKEEFEVEPILDEVIQIFKLYADWKKVQISVQGTSEGKKIFADKKGLHLVFRNILDNALKASPEGSTLMIQLSVVNGHVQLTIQDQGEGMPADTLEKIQWVIAHPYQHERYLKDVGIGTVVIALFAQQNKLLIDLISDYSSGTCYKIIF